MSGQNFFIRSTLCKRCRCTLKWKSCELYWQLWRGTSDLRMTYVSRTSRVSTFLRYSRRPSTTLIAWDPPHLPISRHNPARPCSHPPVNFGGRFAVNADTAS